MTSQRIEIVVTCREAVQDQDEGWSSIIYGVLYGPKEEKGVSVERAGKVTTVPWGNILGLTATLPPKDSTGE